MKIRELHPRSTVTATSSESLLSAAKRLSEEDIGALVVYGAFGAEGIFGERDLARAVADEADLDATQVKDYMTRSPVTIDEESSLAAGITRMNEFGVRHLLVTEANEVVGMISIRDILRALNEPALAR